MRGKITRNRSSSAPVFDVAKRRSSRSYDTGLEFVSVGNFHN